MTDAASFLLAFLGLFALLAISLLRTEARARRLEQRLATLEAAAAPRAGGRDEDAKGAP